MEDKSRMFKDFSFKLVVINSLFDLHPSFEKELEEAIQNHSSLLPFFENVLLTDADMDKVERIVFGNHLKIYELLGEVFEVESMDDMDLLYNLKSICYE